MGARWPRGRRRPPPNSQVAQRGRLHREAGTGATCCLEERLEERTPRLAGESYRHRHAVLRGQDLGYVGQAPGGLEAGLLSEAPPRPDGERGEDRPQYVMIAHMAELVYLDETGAVGKGAKKQPRLILAAVVVDESMVQPLAERMQAIRRDHLGEHFPPVEFHGHDIWSGTGPWARKAPTELLAVMESLIGLLEELSISVIHARIDKEALHERHGGAFDQNAYLLALQFLLEKLDDWRSSEALRVIIADEHKEQQLRAIKLVSDLQTWGLGLVPGRKLRSVIDSMHFVDSKNSYGVQLADVVAFVLHRVTLLTQNHPDADAAVARMREVIAGHTPRYRQSWP